LNKITIITGYYFPEDTAIGLYNTQMVEYLQSKGYDITVITGFPCYPQWKIRDSYKTKTTFFTESYKNTKIVRYKQFVPSTPTFFKRILLLIDFTFGSFFNVLKIKKCDVVICIVPHTSTIFLGWILKLKTKAKLWNHIQDFEFDAAQETGISSKESIAKKLVFKTLFKLETKLLNQGAVNSTISYNMLSKLQSKSKSESFYFPNWIDVSQIHTPEFKPHHYFKTEAFKILYSGNIGDKQDWNFFIQFAKQLVDYNVEIVVVGDGAKREWLSHNISGLANVKQYPPVDYSELFSLLHSTDLHILFQKNNVVDSVMPSKLLGMMASAKPSLISGNVNSEVKTIFDESEGGCFVSENSVEKCVNFVKQLMEHPEKAQKMGLQAKNYVLDKFSSKKNTLNF
jgi:colanic acid biosynthesis glycosyl transferase WcaI